MKMVILDKTFNRTKEINMNVLCVPRIGERVNFGYSPAPKVDSVVYDYEAGTVYVQVG